MTNKTKTRLTVENSPRLPRLPTLETTTDTSPTAMRVRDALKMLSPRSGDGMDSDTPPKFNSEFTPEKIVVGSSKTTFLLFFSQLFRGKLAVKLWEGIFFVGGGEVKLEEHNPKKDGHCDLVPGMFLSLQRLRANLYTVQFRCRFFSFNSIFFEQK